jgi:hypothetical protein
MIDPIGAAAVAAATLFANKVIEASAGDAGKALSGSVARFVDWIRGRGLEDPKTGAALTLAEAMPEDEASVAMLAKVLESRARSDSEFRSELLELVESTPEANIVSMTGGNYIKHVGDRARVTQIAGDQINFADQPPKK